MCHQSVLDVDVDMGCRARFLFMWTWLILASLPKDFQKANSNYSHYLKKQIKINAFWTQTSRLESNSDKLAKVMPKLLNVHGHEQSYEPGGVCLGSHYQSGLLVNPSSRAWVRSDAGEQKQFKGITGETVTILPTIIFCIHCRLWNWPVF